MKNESIDTGQKTSDELKYSLEKLRYLESIIRRSPVIYCIWKLNTDATIEYISDNVSQWGYSPEDFMSGRLSWPGILHPEDGSRLKSEIEKNIKNKRWQFDQHYRVIDSQGNLHWVEDQNTFIFDHHRKITHIQGSIIDVTDRHKALTALQEARNLYQTVFESTGTALAIADEHRNVLLVNEKMEQLTGYGKDELTSAGKDWGLHVHPDDLERLQGYHRQRLAHSQSAPNQYEFRILTKQGDAKTVYMTSELIRGTSRSLISMIDITDWKKDLTALQEARNLYQTIFENTGTAIGITDRDRTILLANKKMEELTGYQVEELTGEQQKWDYHIVPSEVEIIKDRLQKRLIDPSTLPSQYECSLKTKSGEIKNIFMTAALIPGTYHSLVSMIDITDLKKTQRELAKSEERLQELLTKSSDIIAVLDPRGTFKYVSPSVKSILHYDPQVLIGKNSLQYVHPDDLAEIGGHFTDLINKENDGIPSRFRFLCADGSWANLEALGNNCLDNPAIGGIIINTREVSERNRLEEQLLHAQKMEAIGRLAGGIAHDFNNILMGIQGYITLLLLKVDALNPDFEKLMNIQALVQSGSDLTGKLLGFARGGRYELKATDINTLIAKTVQLFGRTKKEISVHQKYERKPWTVEVDRVQMEQVVLNLLVNAWQAMPQGGDIYVETQNVDVGRSRPIDGLVTGNYIKITVADTGMGMDEETRQKIFEPFFTTKEKIRGVGMGLASAFGIIREHGGMITVASEPGKGTIFRIYLPTSNKEVPRETYMDKTILTGEETILLVDDEEIIIDVCRDILTTMGYQIFTAGSGREAVAVYEQNKDRIDLVILDMIMPGINGSETYHRLKAVNPRVKVILSTGFSGGDEAQKILDEGCAGLLQKPFLIESLSQKIREVLDQTEEPTADHPTVG